MVIDRGVGKRMCVRIEVEYVVLQLKFVIWCTCGTCVVVSVCVHLTNLPGKLILDDEIEWVEMSGTKHTQ